MSPKNLQQLLAAVILFFNAFCLCYCERKCKVIGELPPKPGDICQCALNPHNLICYGVARRFLRPTRECSSCPPGHYFSPDKLLCAKCPYPNQNCQENVWTSCKDCKKEAEDPTSSSPTPTQAHPSDSTPTPANPTTATTTTTTAAAGPTTDTGTESSLAKSAGTIPPSTETTLPNPQSKPLPPTSTTSTPPDESPAETASYRMPPLVVFGIVALVAFILGLSWLLWYCRNRILSLLDRCVALFRQTPSTLPNTQSEFMPLRNNRSE